MDTNLVLIIGGAATAVGFYMAWSIGSNDVANSMATSVGSKALTFKQAVVIAGLLNVLGAVLVGSHVAQTVKSDIIKEKVISNTNPEILMIIILGFLASLLAAALWITLSTWKEMPISTTHSVVGAIVGFGLIQWGTNCINWNELGFIASSWVLSPVVGCIIAFFVFKIIVRFIFSKEEPVKSARIVGPFIIGSTAFLIVFALFSKTRLSEMTGVTQTFQIILVSTIVFIIVSTISLFLLRNIKAKGLEDYNTVEKIFGKLQIITACYVAFSHGANDVANAIGPVAGIIGIANEGALGLTTEIPIWLLALGGLGIAIGCLTWGRRVMRTVGGKITSLNHTRGFSVEFSAATTVLFASKLGMPISTSHTVVGAVIGVGLARGLAAVDMSVIRKIVTSWLLTVPVAAITSALIFIGLKTVFIS
ncbi:MAG: phosphate permease [Thermoplasmata archaeon M9B1D]|nr:MAG: phosphate permease [Thermoplasmata archaeon M9B1D]PNX50129.1 MAG: phosphate permease [Thermoplasmata archaeon M8B2D]